MITQKIGRVVPLFKGEYDATAVYDLNDIVTLGGVVYWHSAAQMTKGVAPTETATWAKVFETEDLMPQFKGEYNAEAEYKINNVVKSGNSLYWHVGSAATTGTGVDDSEVWALAIEGPTL